MIKFRENAFSFDQIVSLEAFSAVSILSMDLALVRNWHTNVIGVEDPIFRADQTFLTVPIPGSASNI